MIRKLYKSFSLVVVLSLFIFPNFSSAQTSIESLQAQIAALLSQVKLLQSQLAVMKGTTNNTWCYDFNSNFGIGSSGNDVAYLNTVLDKEGIRSNSNGSSAYYNEDLASYVTAFQEKYRSEILTPANLKSGTGYVGKATRAKLNKLYGCGSAIILPPLDDEYTKNLKIDAEIKNKLSYARVLAEQYYDSNNKSYLGVCSHTDKGVYSTLSQIGVLNSTYQNYCNDTSTTWVAKVKLKTANAGYWCADSTGALRSTGSDATLWNNCDGDKTPTTPLSISYITPTSGNDGQWINIYGSGFTPSTILNITKQGQDVKSSLFNANSVTYISPTQLKLYFDIADSIIKGPGTYQITAVNSTQKSDPASYTVISQNSATVSVKNSAYALSQNITVNLPNQILGGFDVTTLGEPVFIKTMSFNLPVFTTDNASASVLLSNVTLQDLFGTVVAGPVDATVKNGQMTITFTDRLSLPLGTKTFILKGKLSSGLIGSDITVSTNPSTQWTGAEGQTTGNPINLSSVNAFSMSKMSLQTNATLSVSKDASTPALRDVYGRETGVVMGVVKARATNGAVRVANANLVLTSGSINDILGVSIWDGATQLGVGTSWNNSNSINISLTPTIIPQDTEKLFTVKVDVQKYPTPVAIAGLTTIVDLTSLTGTDVVSGYSVTGNNISGSFNGVVINQ